MRLRLPDSTKAGRHSAAWPGISDLCEVMVRPTSACAINLRPAPEGGVTGQLPDGRPTVRNPKIGALYAASDSSERRNARSLVMQGDVEIVTGCAADLRARHLRQPHASATCQDGDSLRLVELQVAAVERIQFLFA